MRSTMWRPSVDESVDHNQPSSARRPPRQDRSTAKIETIVSATARLLAEAQPSESTARTIAAEAGVSPATVYRYFRGAAQRHTGKA